MITHASQQIRLFSLCLATAGAANRPWMPSRCQDFTIMNSSMNSLLSSELLLMKWKARTGRLGQNEFCCVTGKASVFQGTAWHLPSSSR